MKIASVKIGAQKKTWYFRNGGWVKLEIGPKIKTKKDQKKEYLLGKEVETIHTSQLILATHLHVPNNGEIILPLPSQVW